MGEIIIPSAIVRRPGYLYYISKTGDIMEAKMEHKGKTAKKKKVVAKKVVKKK